MMSTDGFMSMNMATYRYIPIEKDDDLPCHRSTSTFPRIGTSGHSILLMGGRNYRWPCAGEVLASTPKIDWEDALEQLSMIRM